MASTWTPLLRSKIPLCKMARQMSLNLGPRRPAASSASQRQLPLRARLQWPGHCLAARCRDVCCVSTALSASFSKSTSSKQSCCSLHVYERISRSHNLCRTQPGSLSFFFHASDLYWGDQKLDLKLGQKVDLGQLVAPSDKADFTVAYGNKGQLVASEVSMELMLSKHLHPSAGAEGS